MPKNKPQPKIIDITTLVIVGFFIVLAIYFYPRSEYLPLPPCDIYATDSSHQGGDDWCQPYIDYGYGNGLVMARRILRENNIFQEIENSVAKEQGRTPQNKIQSCEQIADDIYNVGIKLTEPKFQTRVRKK